MTNNLQADIGYYTLVGAFVLAIYSVIISVLGARQKKAAFIESSERSVIAVASLIVLAVGVLFHALLTNNFAIEYVAHYTSSTIVIANMLFTAWHIPTRYLLARGVEGQSGDLVSVLLGTGIPVFVVGLIFSVLWNRYHKFWPLVMAHWGVDTLPAISSLFGISN